MNPDSNLDSNSNLGLDLENVGEVFNTIEENYTIRRRVPTRSGARLEDLKNKVAYWQQLQWLANTPSQQLRIAIANGDLEKVSQLITQDPSLVNASSNTGPAQPPMFTAIFNNKPDILELLLDKGADVNLRKKGGEQTALNMAAINRYVECVRVLLAFGAPVNDITDITPTNAYHFTPLHSIASAIRDYGFDEPAEKCIKLLLQNGAKRDLKPDGGKTAEEIAPQIREIAEELEELLAADNQEEMTNAATPRP